MTNKSDHRISSLLLLFFIILSGTSVFAQDAMTMLQFEDAEKAFNNGDYAEAIKKIDEVESKTGVTSRTLYLRVLNQEQLYNQSISDDTKLYDALLSNTQKYLDALKNEEIDDKYRKIYAINEHVKENAPGSSVSLQIDEFTANIKDEKVREVLRNYWKAVLVDANPEKIKTTHTEFEYFKTGEQTPFETKTIYQAHDQFYWKYYAKQLQGKYIFPDVVTTQVLRYYAKQLQGKYGYPLESYSQIKKYESGKGVEITSATGHNEVRKDLPTEEIQGYRTQTKGGLSFLNAKFGFMPVFNEEKAQNTTYEEGELNGEPVAIVKTMQEGQSKGLNIVYKQHLYFSLKNHLLLAYKGSAESGPVINREINTYLDYRETNGLLLCYTRKNEIHNGQLKNPEEWNEQYNKASKKRKRELDAELAPIMRIMNPTSVKHKEYTSKLKLIELNKPLPDGLLKMD